MSQKRAAAAGVILVLPLPRGERQAGHPASGPCPSPYKPAELHTACEQGPQNGKHLPAGALPSHPVQMPGQTLCWSRNQG